MKTKAKKPGEARPMGPYSDFDECVQAQIDKGNDEESARKICGKIKAETEDAGAGAPAKRNVEALPYRVSTNVGKVDTISRSVYIVASTPDPVDGEAIVGWDLERFLDNPVILWAHDNTALPIATASEVEFQPGVGLKMRVSFARAEANPLAEQIYQAAIDGIVRAVSVGYDVGPPSDAEEVEEGGKKAKRVVRTRQATLLEVSFVPIGLDPNAGTPALNPEASPAEPTDEEMRARLRDAAATMARHRAAVRRAATATAPAEAAERTDQVDVPDGHVLRMDRMPIRLDRFDRTSVGGHRIPARLSRTGVLTYFNADGTKRRELRRADEIFRADSLATLEDAPVIDIAHHTGMVTPKTWKESALGHVRGAHQEGAFISGDLIIQHSDALDAIAQGNRIEVSLGYTCRLDHTPGVHEGEAYDCVQREIRYNHAALCPPNRGRAGPEVGLRLDNREPAWAVAHFEMEVEMKIRFDGKDYEFGSQEHLDAVERAGKVATEKLQAQLDAAATKTAEMQKRLDAAEGERDTLKSSLEKFNADAAASKAKAEEQEVERKKGERGAVRSKLRLVTAIARFFGDDDKEKDGDTVKCKKCGEEMPSDATKCPECGAPAFISKGKRLDALEDEDRLDALLDMSERDLMLQAIRTQQKDFDDKGRSDDYVRSRFDSLLEVVRKSRGVDGVVEVAEMHARRLDSSGGGGGGGKDPVDVARRNRDQAYANAWKGEQAGAGK